MHRCLHESIGYRSGASAEAEISNILRRLKPEQRSVFVASLPAGKGRRKLVGLVIKGRMGGLRWAISPEHRRQGIGTRMVRLVAELGQIALIECTDVASAKIAERAGFDLIENGPIQLWRADRAAPWT